ncbi:unnamed protein product, partial [Staurois parvus]
MGLFSTDHHVVIASYCSHMIGSPSRWPRPSAVSGQILTTQPQAAVGTFFLPPHTVYALC